MPSKSWGEGFHRDPASKDFLLWESGWCKYKFLWTDHHHPQPSCLQPDNGDSGMMITPGGAWYLCQILGSRFSISWMSSLLSFQQDRSAALLIHRIKAQTQGIHSLSVQLSTCKSTPTFPPNGSMWPAAVAALALRVSFQSSYETWKQIPRFSSVA